YPNMHFKSILLLAGLASFAAAAPQQCSVKQKSGYQVCCKNISLLGCTLLQAGTICSGSSYCCKTNTVQNAKGGLINVNANLIS
ncbi:hypothetical protein BG015_005861, partial [Linnemannia schmuckeri]